MTTNLMLRGWRAEGLRCPDHAVSLQSQEGNIYPISFVQMPNGTGKTTTLQLLRIALSGSAENLRSTQIREFEKRHSKMTNGLFEVELILNNSIVSTRLDFDFSAYAIRQTTTLPSGKREGFQPPREIANFLRPEFVNYFIFDGELAEELLDSRSTRAESVIEYLFQLDLLTAMQSAITAYWQQKTSGRTALDSRGLARRTNRLKFLADRIRKLSTEKATLDLELADAKHHITELNEQFQKRLERQRSLDSQATTLRAELLEKQENIRSLGDKLMSSLRKPYLLVPAILPILNDLKQNLDRVKLPESAAREFFQELLEEKFCVCGRPLDEHARSELESRAGSYLGSDSVALLNSIKGDIGSVVTNVEPKELDLCNNLCLKIVSEQDAEGEVNTRLDDITHQAITSDPEIAEIQSAINRYQQSIDRLETEMDKYTDPRDIAGDGDISNIEVLERRLKDAEDKHSEISDTMDLKHKRDNLNHILQEVLITARVALCKEIVEEANERIATLLPANRIRISEIRNSLVLEGQAGGSAGETLSVAYAFLATLFNRSERRLPFIVDSPANPIDLEGRPRVAELLPKLVDQFVAFTISSERQGFVDNISRHADNIQYITIFRKSGGEFDAQTSQFNTTETQDGFVVLGKEFFDTFQVEEEANGS